MGRSNKLFKERIKKQKEIQAAKSEEYFKHMEEKLGGVIKSHEFSFEINEGVEGKVNLKNVKFLENDFDLLKAIVKDYATHKKLEEGKIIPFSNFTDCVYDLKINKIEEKCYLMEVV